MYFITTDAKMCFNLIFKKGTIAGTLLSNINLSIRYSLHDEIKALPAVFLPF